MNRDELMLDLRTHADLCQRLEEIAASYVPEWRFDRKNPDIGSALALIFTSQMADNIRRMNQLPEKYHTEFINLLGITLRPAHPASGIAIVEPMRGTVPGVALPRGTTLMADGKDGNSILFETTGDMYITNARIADIISISGTKGRIYSILGDLKQAQTVPQKMQETQEIPESVEQREQNISFRLFDYDEPGIEKNAILIYHTSVLATDTDTPVQVVFSEKNGVNIASKLADSENYRWSYFSDGEMYAFDSVEAEGETIILCRERESTAISTDGAEYHVICVEAINPVQGSMIVNDIRIASSQSSNAPGMILYNGEELDAEECMPFGETVSIFDECYICDEKVFSQQNATVTLSFELSYRKKTLNILAHQEAEELKVIKKKSRVVQYQVAQTSPQRIVLEYFNGQAWRKLANSHTWENLMDGTHSGEFNIVFTVPEDWKSVPINGYDGKSLRIRVVQADNCYLLPCEHTMPVLHNVSLSYVYENSWKQPQLLKTICGTQIKDCTKELLEGKTVAVFNTLAYPEASLYIGFDRPLEGSPISMLFEVEENVHFKMEDITFEYSTRTGFRPMKVIDGTDKFSNSGTILFMPPSDFAASEVEGKQRYWIRLCGEEAATQGYHTLIKNIRLNAVDIRNQQTQAEETFYVDTVVPDQTFHLAAKNILRADVFVNELGDHSRMQMRKLIEENPDDIRAEQNSIGEITEFFVRWTEVENFDRSQPTDRHYVIDRANSSLIFGDGVNVRIPQAKQGVAISVTPISCDGAVANLPAGAINGLFGNVLYVESVTNPVPTYAGSNLENLESARARGANIISGRRKLISQSDYLRAVRSFSSTIEKVKCLAGYDIEGHQDPSLITIAVMTDDYKTGAYSFKNIRDELLKHLLEGSDATVSAENLILSEPVYIEISVSVWVKADEAVRAFDIKNLIMDSISDFLDPLYGPGRSGWDIGNLPTENQIKMLLQSLQFNGVISRIITVGRYTDKKGTHEVSLDQMPDTPFAIGVNGEHNVYIEF